MYGVNLLKKFELRRNGHHILFHYYIGGYETLTRTIDYTGTEVFFPNEDFTKEDRKKIYDYLYEHYRYPIFTRKFVKEQLEEYNFIEL